ncbi:uncharacterized protein CIMG_12968 [Coccidioides immitis RS]|uniref:Uncharacterized protein n=1 Tax=Coccidioides immitis (strain RS) TaxID=246410 RepID=J3K2X6_COCIM|nr:uncharacterized protein CIMG_12968 [Coccidioides immitis RS]EAS28484.3 hypothetical protein CIMG_12968 [Coccidioides immitis RS]
MPLGWNCKWSVTRGALRHIARASSLPLSATSRPPRKLTNSLSGVGQGMSFLTKRDDLMISPTQPVTARLLETGGSLFEEMNPVRDEGRPDSSGSFVGFPLSEGVVVVN